MLLYFNYTIPSTINLNQLMLSDLHKTNNFTWFIFEFGIMSNYFGFIVDLHDFVYLIDWWVSNDNDNKI